MTFRADWNYADDWSLFGTKNPAQFTTSRVVDPTPGYRGPVGRFVSAAGATAFNVRKNPPGPNQRSIRASFAMRLSSLSTQSGQSRVGPFKIRSLDWGGTGVDTIVCSYSEVSDGNQVLRFRPTDEGDAGLFYVDRHSHEWLYWIWEAESRGETISYDVATTISVYRVRGSRSELLYAWELDLEIANYDEQREFADFRWGFDDFNGTTDSIEFYLDEVAVGAGYDLGSRTLRYPNFVQATPRMAWPATV